MTMNASDRETVICAMVTAALGAARVMERKNIIPTQTIRTGEFVTQLRRELTYCLADRGPHSIRNQLTQVAVWEDVLVPKSEYTTIEGESLISLATSAEVRMESVTPQAMQADVRQLESMKGDAHSLMTKMDVLLGQAEKITEGFGELAERL